MRCRWRVVAVLSMAAVLGAGWLAPPVAARSPGAEADFLDRVNDARAARGIGPLTSHADVADVARRWSARMRSDNRLSHNPNLANEVKVDWEKLAENVGVGPDVNAIHQAFMNSSAHRTNILDPAFTHIGIGVVAGDDGKLWVTEVFVRIRGASTSRPAPAPAPTTTAPRPPPAPRPAPTTTTPRPAPAPPPTTAPRPPAEAPSPAPAPVAVPEARQPHPRLVLVLEGLRQLDSRSS